MFYQWNRQEQRYYDAKVGFLRARIDFVVVCCTTCTAKLLSLIDTTKATNLVAIVQFGPRVVQRFGSRSNDVTKTDCFQSHWRDARPPYNAGPSRAFILFENWRENGIHFSSSLC